MHAVVMTFSCLLARVVIFFAKGIVVTGCLVGSLGWLVVVDLEVGSENR